MGFQRRSVALQEIFRAHLRSLPGTAPERFLTINFCAPVTSFWPVGAGGSPIPGIDPLPPVANVRFREAEMHAKDHIRGRLSVDLRGKPYSAAFWDWSVHKPANRVKDNLELAVVFFLQRRKFAREIFMG